MTAATVGGVASLALGLGVAMRGRSVAETDAPTATQAPRSPEAGAASPPALGAPEMPVLTRTPRAAVLGEMAPWHERIQTVAVIVGLITGIITIAKELAAVARAVFP